MPPTPPTPPPLPWVYVPRRTRITAYAVAVFVVVAFTVTGVIMLDLDDRVWGPADTGGMIVTALLIAAVAIFLTRPKLSCDHDGCTVVNLFTRRRLAWPQIVHVTYRPGDPWITLDLDDGRTLAVMALQSSDKERFRVGLGKFLALLEAQTATPRND